MSDETQTSFTIPSAKDIEALKKKHGAVFQITVSKGGQEFNAILRKPKLQDMQVASASEKRKPATFNVSIYQNCKIAAHTDPEIEADDELYMGALEQVNEIISFAQGSIKKL